MKKGRNVVAGTDFSSCSQNALEFAADLCSALQTRLIMVHAYRPAGNAGALTSTERQIRKDLRQKMSSTLSSIRKSHPDLEIEQVIRKGESGEVILWASEKFKAVYIIAGTQGRHARKDIFIGSTTGSLVKLGNAPVFAIPEGCQFTPFSRILFAVKNPHVASKNVIQPLLDIQEQFHAHITLLLVMKDSMPDLSRFPNPYPIGPHTQEQPISESENIYTSVQQYLSEHPVDLLVVINRLRGFFEGLFVDNAASASTFNAELPILILHGGARE